MTSRTVVPPVHSAVFRLRTRPPITAPAMKRHSATAGPDHRQVVGAGEPHAQDDDVARHVAGEDAVEPEVSDRVDDAGGEGQRKHQREMDAMGSCHRRSLSP